MNQFEHVVMDGRGYSHLALTRCYHQFRQELSDGTAHTYLMALLPYFSFLETDHWRPQRQDPWDSPRIDSTVLHEVEKGGYLTPISHNGISLANKSLRDLGQVRRRYSRESKADLVERLSSVEQAYLESQRQLARLHFALVEQ